jgi:tRNA 5-methylaminomethyl-2-thiouridine biosynthesis bifunctional protein
MNSADQRWLSAPRADITWDDDCTPRSREFDDVYFHDTGAIEESEYVFLRGNDLAQRWKNGGDSQFTIVETGFGAGLNFLMCWQAWREQAPSSARLHYISVEKYPLRLHELGQAHTAWPSLQSLSEELLSNYPAPLPGRHRILLDGGRLTLDLVLDDACQALDQLQELPGLHVQAWFLDGFSPARNPQMWTQKLYDSMARLSQADTTFATFTAAGHVRRGLEAAGFRTTKETGFGPKREMLRGQFHGLEQSYQPHQTPWHIGPTVTSRGRSAMVIGAGLAGSTCASALAKRGWSVTVLDAGDIAGAASGNSQGILYTRLSHRPSELNDFSLHSYAFATRYYQALTHSGALEAGQDIDWCGALHLMDDLTQEHPLWSTIKSLPELVRVLDADGARRLSGLSQCPGGLFFPTAGWVHPPAVCRALLSHPNITFLGQSSVASLEQEQDCWLALAANGEILARSDIAVITTGASTQSWPQLEWLPLQLIRGQVSHLPSSGELEGLRTVICHDGYLPPARNGEHCIGATFDIGETDTSLREADHIANLTRLGRALPGLTKSMQPAARAPNSGRVGIRTASPDYIPIVGPVPEYAAFCEDYAGLRRNARQIIHKQGSYLRGLYVSTGHGSRGLTSTPLASELLASQICGETWPVDSRLCRALAPARFIVRDLARNRI